MRLLLAILCIFPFLSYGQKNAFDYTKGDFGIFLGLPQINNIVLRRPNETIVGETGFNGLNIGLFYSVSKNQLLEINGTINSTINIPVPGPVSYYGKYDVTTAYSMNLKYSFAYEIAIFSAGISYIQYSWLDAFRSTEVGTESYSDTYKTKAIGPYLGAELRAGKRFSIGLNYSPTVYKLGVDSGFDYSHLMSITFGWRLKLKKGR